MMGITRKAFTQFRNGTHLYYNHVAEQYDFSNIPTLTKLTPEQVVEICERLQNEDTVMSIYKSMDIGRNMVRDIKQRKTYRTVSKDYHW